MTQIKQVKKVRTSITIKPEILKMALDRCEREGFKLSAVIEVYLENWAKKN